MDTNISYLLLTMYRGANAANIYPVRNNAQKGKLLNKIFLDEAGGQT